MTAILTALENLGAARRAAGQPCNPMRAGRDDVDFLTEDEIQEMHVLTLQVDLDARKGVAA